MIPCIFSFLFALVEIEPAGIEVLLLSRSLCTEFGQKSDNSRLLALNNATNISLFYLRSRFLFSFSFSLRFLLRVSELSSRDSINSSTLQKTIFLSFNIMIIYWNGSPSGSSYYFRFVFVQFPSFSLLRLFSCLRYPALPSLRSTVSFTSSDLLASIASFVP